MTDLKAVAEEGEKRIHLDHYTTAKDIIYEALVKLQDEHDAELAEAHKLIDRMDETQNILHAENVKQRERAEKAEAERDAELAILREELKELREANGQFGVGA